MAERSFYDVLNVAPGAEPEVIEAAYRALMKKYHPDRASGASAAGPDPADINAAFAMLRDRRRRADYDRRLHAQRAPKPKPHPAPAPAATPAWTPSFRPVEPTPRRLNAVAWSGWGIALAFGCFAVAAPTRDPGMTVVPPAFAALPSDVDADLEPARAQPSAAMVGIDASRLPAHLESIEEVLRDPAARGTDAAAPPSAEPSEPPRAEASLSRRSAVPAPAPRGEASRPRRQSDREFLESQGFIY